MGWNGQDRLSGWVDYCACCCCWVCVSMMGKLDVSFCSLSERIGIHVRRFLLVQNLPLVCSLFISLSDCDSTLLQLQLQLQLQFLFYGLRPFLVDQRPRKKKYTALPVEMILLLYISGGSVVWNRELFVKRMVVELKNFLKT